MVARRVWERALDLTGGPSPDGRYLSYVDWETGDLAVRDLKTGKNRRLTNKSSWSESTEYAYLLTISQSGKQVAYAWFNKDFSYDLRLVGLDGSDPRVLYSNEEGEYLAPAAWSPDGKHVLAIFAVQQESSGRSDYHGLTVSLSKRFSTNFEFLSNYTWSHAIDDSTDLQTLLSPQDNRNPGLERGNSTFDQRHRWVFSAIFQSPTEWRGSAGAKKIFAGIVVAPIVEVSSGRPYSVLTGTDFNLDLGSNTDRPSAATSGGVYSPFIPGTSFTLPTVCDETFTLGAASLSPPFGCTGNLGRNTFTRPGFAQVDLRVSRKIELTEWRNLDLIMDAFNLFNRFNVGDVNPLCNPLDPATCRAGEPTAALDPRQFQFALKLNW